MDCIYRCLVRSLVKGWTWLFNLLLIRDRHWRSRMGWRLTIYSLSNNISMIQELCTHPRATYLVAWRSPTTLSCQSWHYRFMNDTWTTAQRTATTFFLFWLSRNG
jgi:hypothetical protein